MKVILLGAPGAGKGTQAAKIVEEFNVTHISTGDILRKNIKDETSLGKEAKEYVEKGLLVPDELVIALVKETVCKLDSFLFDGFPRTIEQAKAVDEFAVIQKVLNLQIPDEILLERGAGRRVCKLCANVTHLQLLTGSNCPKCGGELYQRNDDSVNTIKSRMEVYKKQTAPLIEYYRKQNKLIDIYSGRESHQVFEDVKKILSLL